MEDMRQVLHGHRELLHSTHRRLSWIMEDMRQGLHRHRELLHSLQELLLLMLIAISPNMFVRASASLYGWIAAMASVLLCCCCCMPSACSCCFTACVTPLLTALRNAEAYEYRVQVHSVLICAGVMHDCCGGVNHHNATVVLRYVV